MSQVGLYDWKSNGNERSKVETANGTETSNTSTHRPIETGPTARRPGLSVRLRRPGTTVRGPVGPADPRKARTNGMPAWPAGPWDVARTNVTPPELLVHGMRLGPTSRRPGLLVRWRRPGHRIAGKACCSAEDDQDQLHVGRACSFAGEGRANDTPAGSVRPQGTAKANGRTASPVVGPWEMARANGTPTGPFGPWVQVV